MFKIALIIIVLIWSFNSFSEPFVQVGTGAYFGSKYLDLGYSWKRFNTSLGVGDIKENDWQQFNLKLKLVTTVIGFKKIKLHPVNLGLAVLYSSDPDFFIKNRSNYPEDKYYDSTAFRAALTYQGEVLYRQVALFYDITWLDQGVYTQFNNQQYGDKFLSWGMGVKYVF